MKPQRFGLCDLHIGDTLPCTVAKGRSFSRVALIEHDSWLRSDTILAGGTPETIAAADFGASAQETLCSLSARSVLVHKKSSHAFKIRLNINTDNKKLVLGLKDF